MEDLVVLASVAVRPVPTVIAGRMTLASPRKPLVGIHLTLSAIVMMSISPSQKLGIDSPRKLRTMQVLSVNVPRLMAE